MKILIWGINGRLGTTLGEIIKNTKGVELIGGVDICKNPDCVVPVFDSTDIIDVKPDVIVDFSSAKSVHEIFDYATKNKIPVVLCSTGHSASELEFVKKSASEVAVFKSANMSLGINLLIDLAKRAKTALGEKFDIEIIEKHHNLKADAPSGTALAIAEALKRDDDEFVFGRHNTSSRRKKNEIGIHAVRGGTVVGTHDVLFLGNDEIITISHEANSKAVFAEGALLAAKFILGKPAGVYSMSDLLGEI